MSEQKSWGAVSIAPRALEKRREIVLVFLILFTLMMMNIRGEGGKGMQKEQEQSYLH
ncbi:MAG: hypothetical protein HQK52_16540 [Oligoflexia bacterium]|nr:hypothetical protein [Oligoflexia bacterium]